MEAKDIHKSIWAYDGVTELLSHTKFLSLVAVDGEYVKIGDTYKVKTTTRPKTMTEIDFTSTSGIGMTESLKSQVTISNLLKIFSSDYFLFAKLHE